MDDDVSNNGSYFLPLEPPEQAIDRKKERAAELEIINAIETAVKHFNERIAFRDSLSAIKVDLAMDPALHQKVCEVNELLKLALIEERELLQEKLDMYAP